MTPRDTARTADDALLSGELCYAIATEDNNAL